MARSGQGRGATGLALGVLLVWLLAAVLAAVGVAPRAQAPPAAPPPAPGPVVVVGVPGLTWDLVPALQDGNGDGPAPSAASALPTLAAEGGAAALVLRGIHETTCAADAWLTLGAGQRAATDVDGCVDAELRDGAGTDGSVPVLPEDLVEPQGDGAVVDAASWARWTNQAARRSLGTELGTLADQMLGDGSCVAAYDPLAALAAADADGRVSAYRTGAGGQGDDASPSPDLVADCSVHLLSTAPADTEAVAEIVEGLPDDATVVVAGLGHVEERAEAMALVVHAAGSSEGGSALTSGSTQQRSLVQLTDLTATVLHLAGVEEPFPDAVAGQPAVAVEEGSRDAADVPDPGHVEDARALAAGITLAKAGAPWVLGAVAAVLLVLLVVSVVRGRRQRTGSRTRIPGTAVVATAVMAIPVATFLTGPVPWWELPLPVTALAVGVLVMVGLLTALSWAGPWRWYPLGPASVVAAVTLAVVGTDLLWSARLGLVSVLGLQPVSAGRFYGQGNVGFGIVLGSYLVLAAAVIGPGPRPSGTDGTGPAAAATGGGRFAATRKDDVGSAAARRDGVRAAAARPDGGRPGTARSDGSRRAAAVVLALGAAAVVLNAAPQAGADFGGVPALVVATGLMALAALRVRWSVGVLALLGLAGLGVAATVMLLDWTRGPGRRTHLGDFVQRVLDGTALEVVTRKLEQSLGILLAYPLSWLAVLALVLLAVAVRRRPGWAAALWRHEGMYRALVAGVVTMVLGWVLNDSGIAVVALALTVLLAGALSLLGVGVDPDDLAGRAGPPDPAGGTGEDLQLVPGAVAPGRAGKGASAAVDPRRHG
ncbi:hypothetical protein ACPYOC_12915 [Ornithinimicrobium sp. W1665]|uniref:hypothetical protein n=1 Tax=Ornithinimicrobium sp. W1665 TaxID=3416666 RepID=UPI003CF619C5